MNLKEQIEELKGNLVTYQNRRDDLLGRQGVIQSIESLTADLKKAEKDLAIQKRVTKELKKQREDALQSVCLKISTEIDKFLTEGEASIQIDEGKVKIGWIIDKKFLPISSLSGGEIVEFFQAFSQAIMPGGRLRLNFVELAESGRQAENILGQIIQASGENNQTIACSWMVGIKGEGWQTIKLE